MGPDWLGVEVSNSSVGSLIGSDPLVFWFFFFFQGGSLSVLTSGFRLDVALLASKLQNENIVDKPGV